MACTTTQADLGPLFADVDADLATAIIEQATSIVLGPSAAQATTEASMTACGLDPCALVVLTAQHLLSVLPGSGVGGSTQTVTSERVGEVSTSYGTASSASGLWAGSAFGSMVQLQLARYEQCQARRRSFPMFVGPSRSQP